MRKKSLSLMLAASVISSMFSVGVSAVGYKFNTPQGNLLVHEVLDNGNCFIIDPGCKERMDLIVLKNRPQRFAFEVKNSYLTSNGIDASKDENHWLGAGQAGLNLANDYDVKATFTKGNGAVLVNIIRGPKCFVREEGSLFVQPLIVEFTVCEGVGRNIELEGFIDITSAGQKQQVHFSGTIDMPNANRTGKGIKYVYRPELDTPGWAPDPDTKERMIEHSPSYHGSLHVVYCDETMIVYRYDPFGLQAIANITDGGY